MNTKQQLIITWSNINKQINSIQSTINNITSMSSDIDAAISKWHCLKVEHRPKLALADRVLKLYPENFWKSYFICINT